MATALQPKTQPQPQLQAVEQPEIVGIKKADLEKLQSDLAAANKKISELQACFFNSLTTRSENDTRQVEIQRQLSLKNDQSEQTISALRQSVDLLSKRVLQLQEELGESQKHGAQLEDERILNQATFQRLQGDMERLVLTHQQTEQQVKRLQMGHEQVSGDLNALNQKVETAERENAQLSAQILQNQNEKEKQAREAPLRKEREELLAQLTRIIVKEQELLKLAKGGFPFYGVFGGFFAGCQLESAREEDIRIIAPAKQRIKEISDQLNEEVTYPLFYAETQTVQEIAKVCFQLNRTNK